MPFSQSNKVFYRPDPTVLSGIVIFALLVAFALVTRMLMEKETGFAPLYLLSLIQLGPIAICYVRQRYNYIAFILFNHFFTYSVHKFNQYIMLGGVYIIPPTALRAIEELTTCSVFIIVGYFASRTLLPSARSREPYQLLSLKRWQLVIISLYVILVPFFLEYIPGWYLAIHFTIMGADMMLLLSSNSPGHERLATALKVAVFFSTIWFFIYTGMLALVGVLAAYVFIAACIRRKLSFFLLPVILTVVGSGIQTVKFEYRKVIWNNPTMPAFERFGLLTHLLTEKFSGNAQMADAAPVTDDPEEDTEDKLLKGFERIGDDSLERVLDWTPKKVPFWEGETYAHIPYIFIPRVLWPDKPSRRLWHKFGRVYGYLSEDDKATSVGVTYLAEAYMNYGFPGMYTVAFLFGVFVWLVESFAAFIFKGNFAFTFMVFLIPLQWYAADLGTILNSVLIISLLLLVFRTQFLAMARKDAYTAY